VKWKTKLAYPLYTRDGKQLKTLDDARRYAVGLPDGIGERNEWQHAAALLLAAAAGGDVEPATEQMRLALFLGARLDVSKMQHDR
jgi:hypothetical protein